MKNRRLLSLSIVSMLACMAYGCGGESNNNTSDTPDTPEQPGQMTDCSNKPGTVLCNGNCIDPSINQNFCGADKDCKGGTACVDGEMCKNGTCQQRPETCIDSGSDINCQTDDPNAEARCDGNNCVIECKDGFGKDDGFCKSTDTPKTCDPGRVLCNGNCIDPLINNTYCGADSNCQNYIPCNGEDICLGGSCTEKPATCIDSGSDINCQTDDPNAEARCDSNNCVVECKDGFGKVDGFCTAMDTPQDKVCEPNKRQCSGGGDGIIRSYLCNSDGTEILSDTMIECTNDDPNAKAMCDENGECMTQCNEGYVKVDGKCALVNCTEGETRCDDNRVMICNESKTGFDVHETCTTAEPNKVSTCTNGYCSTQCDDNSVQDESGNCVTKVCDPYEFKCEGTNVMQCNPFGTEFTLAEECSPYDPNGVALCKNGQCSWRCKDNYINIDNVCELVACEPGEKRCDGDRVMVCNSMGIGYDVEKTCESDDHYLMISCENNDCVSGCMDGYTDVDGVCTKIICEPNALGCDGDKIVKCNSTGTAYEPKESCTTSDPHAAPTCKNAACTKVCNNNYIDVDGTCTQVACTAGQKLCDGSRVVQCNSDGTGYTLLTDCDSIDPNATGICHKMSDDVFQCQKTCKDGYAENNMNGGKCMKIICSEGERKCSGSSILPCHSSGTMWDHWNEETCTTDKAHAHAICSSIDLSCQTVCDDGYTDIDGVCVETVCTPNSVSCIDANTVGICKSDGTGYEGEPISCRADQKCDQGVCKCKQIGYVEVDGECKELTCRANQMTCAGIFSYGMCNATGTGIVDGTEVACRDDQYCDTTDISCKCQYSNDIECDGVCMNPNSDDYCGVDASCNYTRCTDPNDSCQYGECVCNEGFVRCGEHCIDPKTSTLFCGADNTCGNYTACGSNEVCNNGSCDCSEDTVRCGEQCIDPLTSLEYCGADNACGNYTVCGAGQTCQNGSCVCVDTNLVICNGNCIDPQTNSRYCGVDATCSGATNCSRTNRICKDGACECAEGLTWVSVPGSYFGLPVSTLNGCVNIMNSQAFCGTSSGLIDNRNCYTWMLQNLNGLDKARCQLKDDPSCNSNPIICDASTGICNVNPACIPDTCEFEPSCEEGTCTVKQCIAFADSAIETYALAHWDTNGDSCISPKEARAVTEIPDYAFIDNKSVTTLVDLNRFKNLTTIGKEAFIGCTNLKKVYLTNVTTIAERAFMESGVETINLQKVGTVPSQLCANCSKLTSVDLPNATIIMRDAFNNTTSLESANIPKVVTLETNAFLDAKLKTLALPSVKTIGDAAFSGILTLTSVTLNENNEDVTIGEDAFKNNIRLVTVSGGNIVKVKEKAFNSCSNLESIDLTNVTEVGNYAFANSFKLKNLTPDGRNRLNKIITIGTSAFANTGLYQFVHTSGTLKNVGVWALSSNPNLNTVSLRTTFNNFDWSALESCPNLEYVTIDDLRPIPDCESLDLTIGQLGHLYRGRPILENTFKGCKGIKRVISYADEVKQNAFRDAVVDSVILPEANWIGVGAFLNTTFNKEENNDFSAVFSIEKSGFYGSNLTSISLPNVNDIGAFAFAFNRDLNKIYLPKIHYIGKDAFYYTKFKSHDLDMCVAAWTSLACKGTYCVSRNDFNQYWFLNWDCPAGTTCQRMESGSIKCE